MGEAVVSFAVERLGDLLLQEANSLRGVKGRVERLQRELRSMQCFLKDTDARKTESESIRNWVAELRDVAYDAEDVIETFALHVASRRNQASGIKNVLKWFVCIPNEWKALYSVGSEIKALNDRISDLTRRSRTYSFKQIWDNESSSSAHQRLQQLRRTYSHVVEGNIIGLEGHIKVLVDRIVKEKSSCRVVSICGMGGLGKTTLAKKVYHHGEVRSHFDCIAWSCLSKEFRPRYVWEGLLTKLTCQPTERLSDDEIAKRLYQLQQQKKCLVILDDIWYPQSWDCLKAAFPTEGTSSMLLLTTRNKEVAQHVDRNGFLYEPKCLNDDQSWKLLQKIMIPREDGVGDKPEFRIDTKMEELGKKMTKHCAGLPLAITVLGSLLATKCTLDQWHMVNDNMGRGKGHNQKDSTVSNVVLSLSYDDLPPHLKQCFCYLGHFPEDCEINADKLVKLWIADGIITSRQDELEDVAEGYLDELIERSMVLVGKRDIASSKVLTCRMHDVMRDLCLEKAEEECFLKVTNAQIDENDDVLNSSSSWNGKFRRLSVHLQCYDTFRQKLIRSAHLRSVLYITKTACEWDLLGPSFKNFKVLRVLDLENVRIGKGKLPRDIGVLIHLRFLSLRRVLVSELPSSLGNLRLLETLDLRVVNKLHVPNVIWKMKKLRHLYLPYFGFDGSQTKLLLGTLRQLRTLVNFQYLYCDVTDLSNMTNLKEFRICGEYSSIESSMAITLRSLSVKCFSGATEVYVSGYINLSRLHLDLWIEKLPELPRDITVIHLRNCQLKEDPMPLLEVLPKLRILVLDMNAFTGREMSCSRHGFPQLHSLELFELRNLVE